MLVRKSAALCLLGLVLLCAQPDGHAQAGGDALKFFQNYFVTGDYVVAGVGLRGQGGQNGSPAGLATGTINVSGVPVDADIIAAFLYWQVVSSTALGPDSGAVSATFDGSLLSAADGPLSKVLLSDGTAACWTASSGDQQRTYTYRADVRRFLPVGPDGRLVTNGPHVVQLPDSGPSASADPIALGSSLVIIYRDPRMPLRAVVLYDGGSTMNEIADSMSQTIQGFYQTASSPSRPAQLTHIVGSGQASKFERLLLPGLAPIINPFTASSGDSWDNPTFAVTVPAGSASTTTSVDHVGFNPFDCLTWGAVVFSTEVQDTDGDGLLDVWESSTNTLLDPNNRPLPNLNALGANPNHKDLFVEIGFMHANVDTTYGGVLRPAHTHLPDPAALKMVGDAFKNAPVHNPDSVDGIDVHFDVGNNYQGGEAGPYVIAAAQARGGEGIEEAATVCPYGVCEFPDFPGTVGWKVGYKFYRDQLLSATPPPLDAFGNDPCDVPGVSPGNDDGPGGLCERRFDRNRMDMFHYVLSAHLIGLPKSEFPCLDGSVPPVPVGALTDGSGLCAVADNPDFHIPRTSSGVADFPGGDLMLTLGGFSDAAGRPVGTPFMQASTLLHELGHNFDLSHSGVYQVPVRPPEPNCKPNYLSSMNYLFQLRGLFNDDPLNPGVPHLDFSGQRFAALDEDHLQEKGELGFDLDSTFGFPLYHTGWYSPVGIGSPATKHCDGSELLRDAEGNLTEPPMFRVDGPSGYGIDWDFDGLGFPAPPQDINFDGRTSILSEGSNDWANLRLTQLATRRNVLGLSVDLERDDLGRGDTLGRDGLGRDGLGRDGLGRDGLGRDGLGRDGLGRDGLGRDGLGRDGLGRDGLGRDGLGLDGPGLEEVDTEIAAGSGNAPPNSLTVCQIGIGPCSGAPFHRINLTWKATNVNPDRVFQYIVSRYRTSDPTQTPTLVGQALQNGTVDYSLVDSQELPSDSFTYYAIAEYLGDTPAAPHIFSGQSNLAAIIVINDAPVANDDSYNSNAGAALNVPAPGVLGNDTDDDSASLSAVIVAGPSHANAFALNANGSFAYTPAPGFIGTDVFTYKAMDIDPTHDSTATVSITVASDQTPPIVTLTIPSPNAQGWFTTKPVVVGVSATDPATVTAISCVDIVNGTPVAIAPSLSGGGTISAGGNLSLSAEGIHSVSCTATDGLGNTGAASGSSVMPATVKIDTVPPIVTITTPADNATPLLRSSVASSFSCSDGAAPPASGLASCVGTVANGSNINTATVGPKSFTVTAKDVAGNTTTVTNNYTVLYSFILSSMKSPANQGSAVPINWVLKDALGNTINSLTTLLKMESVFNGPVPPGGCVPSTVGAKETLYSPATGATGGSNFRLVSGGYQFNWDTSTTTTAPIVTGKGCYTVLIYLDERPDLTNPRMTTPVVLK